MVLLAQDADGTNAIPDAAIGPGAVPEADPVSNDGAAAPTRNGGGGGILQNYGREGHPWRSGDALKRSTERTPHPLGRQRVLQSPNCALDTMRERNRCSRASNARPMRKTS